MDGKSLIKCYVLSIELKMEVPHFLSELFNAFNFQWRINSATDDASLIEA